MYTVTHPRGNSSQTLIIVNDLFCRSNLVVEYNREVVDVYHTATSREFKSIFKESENFQSQ